MGPQLGFNDQIYAQESITRSHRNKAKNQGFDAQMNAKMWSPWIHVPKIKKLGVFPNDEKMSQTSSKTKFFVIHMLWVYDAY